MTIIDSANALLKDKEDESPTREEAEKAVKVLIKWAGDANGKLKSHESLNKTR